MAADKAKALTSEFFDFVHKSPTAAHAVKYCAAELEKAGYVRFEEGDAWDVGPITKGYTLRGQSTLVAFRLGTEKPKTGGFRIVGSHTDSPGFRLKPNPVYTSEGYLMLGIEVYGGPLLGSWTDRDLSLAGQMVVRDGDSMKTVLVDVARPVCRIPQLAVHLNRKVNDKGLKLNEQQHLPPILGLTDGKEGKEVLDKLLAEAAGVSVDAILDYELDLYDVQPSAFGGLNEEFYFSKRIDNLTGCFTALKALLEAQDDQPATAVVALYDNEEIGSNSYLGAASTALDTVLERLCLSDGRESFLRALSRSILFSSDGAHAVHPNYADMHDKRHQPRLNGGPVIKFSARNKFATSAQTKAHFMLCAEKADAPYQLFVNRSDLVSGSTIGPIASTRLGIPTVDSGVPMLSMHSARECGGVLDMDYMRRILIQHFQR